MKCSFFLISSSPPEVPGMKESRRRVRFAGSTRLESPEIAVNTRIITNNYLIVLVIDRKSTTRSVTCMDNLKMSATNELVLQVTCRPI